ncbi:hypothetical protein B0H21DRAFT_773023 [Amylocystis lapponica]|nr:hypothetical protein B0H21DRAFT_773023 [Amylocystis lapponica]
MGQLLHGVHHVERTPTTFATWLGCSLGYSPGLLAILIPGHVLPQFPVSSMALSAFPTSPVLLRPQPSSSLPGRTDWSAHVQQAMQQRQAARQATRATHSPYFERQDFAREEELFASTRASCQRTLQIKREMEESAFEHAKKMKKMQKEREQREEEHQHKMHMMRLRADRQKELAVKRAEKAYRNKCRDPKDIQENARAARAQKQKEKWDVWYEDLKTEMVKLRNGTN